MCKDSLKDGLFMNEQPINLPETLRRTAEHAPALGARKKELRRALGRLREQYHAASGKREKSGWQQWLCDNFYTLEGEAKQAIAEMDGFSRSGRQTAALAGQMQALFCDAFWEISEETLLEVLFEINRLEELGETAFDFLLPAVRAALVMLAAREDAPDDSARERWISRAVVSLGQLAEIDFEQLTDRVSVTEQIFRQDPAGVYPRMAGVSRRHYRHVAARIGKMCGDPESRVAKDILECAKSGRDELRRHVGFYLMSHDPKTRRAHMQGIAAASFGVLFPLFLCILLGGLLKNYWASPLLFFPLAALTRLFLCPFLLRGIVHSHLPRMKLAGSELPPVVVAVTTLLPRASETDPLKARLEQLYFSNRAENLRFCVIADYKEDRKPFHTRDDAMLTATREMVESLNREHGNRFMLFARRRVYCKTQEAYCGWERKRGAIEEFIRFASGGESSVVCFTGDRDWLSGMRYLLTLDADTGLGFDAANRLTAAAVHPLNQPIVGEHGRVIFGYGVLRPRMAHALLDERHTRFAQMMTGENGVSSYEREYADSYQDLLGESCFVGKGLLDVEAYRKVLFRRFPENAMLSHDIPEGAYLRTGLVSDVEMTETSPDTVSGWLLRLHRWMRGDWQNLRFIGPFFHDGAFKRKNPIGWRGRLFLLENLRDSLTAVLSVLGVLLLTLGVFGRGGWAFWCNLLILFSFCADPLKQACMAAVREGYLAFARRFFGRGLPRFWELLAKAGGILMMTTQRAVVTVDAMARALWRMVVSKRNLLEWTTAAQSTGEATTVWPVLKNSWPSMLIGFVLIVAGHDPAGRLFGFLSLFYPLFALWSSGAPDRQRNLPDRAQREQLTDWCARMLGYFDTYANKKNRWLPPDNVQYSPVEVVARRTSPTNIGLMLLSYLTARDLKLIDSENLYSRLSRVLDTIDRLETYHGNLYNWYATDDLRVLPNRFVSSVDSGNYLCALVALKEGVLEYSIEEPKLRLIAARVETILQETDFSIFYDARRKLFSIGIDENGEKSHSHYDFLMSEARTASYFAVASRQAPVRHWRALSRAMSRSGPYIGPVSWTGTMFEYYMPHLLLPVYEGSLLGESLRYALHCQKRRAARDNLPWGISESGYLAFDDALNYQYKAHGVQRLAVKQGMDTECVVSPYSSFLALPYDLDNALQNLSRLAEYGMEGRYGFYEAIDFTHGRAGKNGWGLVQSYMAHHVGMSMVSCGNVLLDQVMQKRFMRDRSMRAARELLQEKQAKGTVVFDRMKQEPRKQARRGVKPVVERHDRLIPQSPACTMLGSRSLTHFFTDTGVSFLRYSDADVTRRCDDLLLRPQGIFTVAYCQGRVLTATAAPFYPQGQSNEAIFEGDAVCYRGRSGEIELSQRFSIDRALPVEKCVVTLTNHSDAKSVAELLFYLEPVLSRNSEYAAHPAFSKLFVMGEHDTATDTVTFFRRHRDCSDGLHLTIGFEKSYDYAFSLKREEVTPYPDGLWNLARPDSVRLEGGTATPDACLALRLPVMLPPRGKTEVTLFLSVAPHREESVDNLVMARQQSHQPAFSPLQNDAMAGRMGSLLLPALLFDCQENEAHSTALAENERAQDGLWTLGISGDRPVVLYDWDAKPDRALLDAYLRFWRLMRLHRLDFDLCVLGQPEGKLPGGVHTIQTAVVDSHLLCLLRAAACAVVGAPNGLPATQIPMEQSVQPATPPPEPFCPAAILPLSPAPIPAGTGRFDVVGGAYLAGRFYVERVTPLPFSHILANEKFGCLLQDASLGNSWWQNARECKLSPWKNDIATGNDGERLVVLLGGRLYDLCKGARASFSPSDAWYEGFADRLHTHVEVTIDPHHAVKMITVTLENTGEQEIELVCAYAVEPVLGVSPMTAKYTRFALEGGSLLLHNPYPTEMAGHLAVHAPGERPSYMTRRANFYAGRWAAQELSPNNDPIAGTLIRKHLPARRKEQIRFILAAADTGKAAATLAANAGAGALPPVKPASPPPRTITIQTPSEPLNCYINTFAPHQILAGRLLGRTAFYQCSGAFGFRDQLQDAGGYLTIDPSVAARQILRCCAAQFREGDVLHWWHPLPRHTRGVRTRFSDDLLWLPMTVCDYLDVTGDYELLRQKTPYCTGEELAPGEQERYMTVSPDTLSETVYEHCVRAVERGHRLGEHGLVLIGCGDWNDGFSRVGEEGKGESVWLSMFLIILLERFATICDRQCDSSRADQWRGWARNLREKCDQNAWDGNWYLRAFYDDGAPLGGQQSEECKIDLLPQSFAVLSGMPDQARVQGALTEALARLVDYEHGIIKLFAPPFQAASHNPGYIKAYPTGVRENGGQYTHAAIWLAAALLKAGRAEEGWTLLNFLNPTARCTNAAIAREMKTEPYYIAADIYTHAGCYGHGGWSIYTGAAAWFYRTVVTELLGLRFTEGCLTVQPILPPGWSGFSAQVRQGDGTLRIFCKRTGHPSLTVDGHLDDRLPCDGRDHEVVVEV